MNENIFERSNQLIKSCNTAYIGVIGENGFPSVSTVMPVNTDSLFETFFATGLASNKAMRLQKNNQASVCYHVGGNNITLVGTAEILTDQATKSRFWHKEGFLEHFPGGETDPNYCIIRVTTKRFSLWVDNEYAQLSIDELLTVQSRCGMVCSGCSSFIDGSCVGCIALNGKSSWGDRDCSTSRCCIDKGHAHCGKCADFPCNDITGMSIGDDDACDHVPGASLAICRAWAERGCAS